MGNFRAELDEMQAVIDGRLADAVEHFTTVSNSVGTLSQDSPASMVGPDLGGIGANYARTLTTILNGYTEDHRQLVIAITHLRDGLQHVVDVYRKAEADNTEIVRSAG